MDTIVRRREYREANASVDGFAQAVLVEEPRHLDDGRIAARWPLRRAIGY